MYDNNYSLAKSKERHILILSHTKVSPNKNIKEKYGTIVDGHEAKFAATQYWVH